MNLERYPYQKKALVNEYEFYSDGTKGRIHKMVRFRKHMIKNIPCFNLEYGDWDERLREIDDMVVSDNGDTEKVLATVAAIVVHFMAFNENAIVHAEGSTMARTRKYQMGINKVLNEMEEMFDVYGVVDEQLQPFRKNVNYTAFFIKRRQYLCVQEPREVYIIMPQKNNRNKKIQQKEPPVFEVIDFDPSPFGIRKSEAFRRTAEKVGLPEEFVKAYLSQKDQ